MDYSLFDKRFSFRYGDRSCFDLSPVKEHGESGNTVTDTYIFDGALRVTSALTLYPEYSACRWVNTFENISSEPTEIISELWDCDIFLPLPHDEKRKRTAFLPADDEVTKIISAAGSDWSAEEFSCDADRLYETKYENHIAVGETRKYACTGGRSSEHTAPFFNIHSGSFGIVFAVGWSGQWNAEITREENSAHIKSKVEDTHFRLLPGEKIRTSSAVIMMYDGDIVSGQNKWRRLVKNHFSLMGKEGRLSAMPLCAGIWGGMSTEGILKRIDVIKKNALPFEYLWIDAGWYGMDSKPSPDEFEGDWTGSTGDWRVNPYHHPDGLKNVCRAVREAGMKLLLWVEPERVVYSTPIVSEHPEYFIMFSKNERSNCLLNLGREDAWNYCYKTLSSLIEELDVKFYRQDFNMSPLPYWRKGDGDSGDRCGITEIKHITGMYRLWDALLSRFPSLMIDNCASGGRRIDIETLSRSVPLWRSDAQCPANATAALPQSHNISYSSWLPYNGDGCGRMYDTYHIRSCYAGGMTTNFTYSENDAFGGDEGKLAWLKARCEEYLSLRKFFYGDMYPLTEISNKEDVWSAVQFDVPEDDEGIVEVFRRPRSPYVSACFFLGNIDEKSDYSFTSLSGEERIISGKVLAEDGFCVELAEHPRAEIFRYRKLR